MTIDKNKGITAITYNHLNLPTTITFGTTGNITYIYNALGQKVQKIVNSTGVSAVTTDYLGGYQYKNAVLQFFPTAEGYFKQAAGSSIGLGDYVYNYTDHLGNVRLSYQDTNKNGTIDIGEILDETNYYPFGLKHEGYSFSVGINYKYKYNGKELQDELGLNMYDYGARNYDPALGRWMNIDPLAEMYHGLSGYTYCLNNPLSFIDPTGMAVEEIDGGVKFTENDAKSAFMLLTGKSKNAYVAVVGDEKDRNAMNADDKQFQNGQWAVLAVSNLSLGAKAMDMIGITNNSLDNLIVANHGGQLDNASYFANDEDGLKSGNSISTNDLKGFNSKDSNTRTKSENEVNFFKNMANMVKDKGNFILNFCETGKGDVGKTTLKELKTLLEDRINLYLPTTTTKLQTISYTTGPGLNTNGVVGYKGTRWIQSQPGVQNILTVNSIHMSKNGPNALIIK